ncbi:MAG TPA: branched-chain amino acid ABC transporter permease [Actinomycetota bacterium]|nr:branched-chain amino acid ABC transporter permease [Actinomycetota bacterium]
MDCNSSLLGPALVTGTILGFLYALIALGYTMVYGVLKLINFAHDAVFAVGAIGTWFLFGEILNIDEPKQGLMLVLVILAVLLVGGLVSAGGAALLERTAYRPLRKRHAARLSYLISAIGASFFATYLFQQDFLPILLGPGPQQFPHIIAAGPEAFSMNILGSRVTTPEVLMVVVAVICFIVLDRVINQTSTGRSIRALSEDPIAAQLMGVNVDRVIVVTFLIGGFFGGIAGAMYGLLFGSIAWNLGFTPGVKAFTAAVLGGIGNIRGAMLGAILLGLIENLSTVCIDSEWKNVVAFTILPLVLIFRPTGIMGERIGG